MKSQHALRNLLALWGSAFLYRYTPEVQGTKWLGLSVAEYTAEEEIGPLSILFEGLDGAVRVPEELLKVGRQYAKKWEVPMTLHALIIALLNCRNYSDVQMMIAVTMHQFRNLNARDRPLITVHTVSQIFQKGLPSHSWLDNMWEKQKLLSLESDGTRRNLLDHVHQEDFITTTEVERAKSLF